ncbi:solute carrier family 26 member 10 isoform X2 [Bactrocera dorsalis]|uniref:Solute carrier family 26 member 10 isoform X2 n=1 Tax=Bactrocera dorsalis TaxID=27457 RepID=A0A8N4QEU7_BACDO|nr:solute carrier family 26 member 10 isoform X2 [Bactrocera dorsalis]
MFDKPINLKNVRKFAVEHFKRRRAPHGNATRQPTPLAADSVGVSNRVYVGNGDEAGTSSAISLSAGSIKATRLASVDALELASVVKVSKPTGTKPKLPKRLRATATTTATAITPRTSLRHKQYKQRLQQHPYTDVVVDASESRKMAQQNGDNETKPLTQAYLTEKPKIQPKYDVHRDVLSHEVVIKQTGYGARDKSIPSGVRRSWEHWSFLSLFVGIIPIVQWLPRYSLRRDAMGDLVAGITVAIMNIPHGMAYGILAGVTPGCGLSLAIFPVIVYMILGTSKHISIGTFAVISMMTLKVVQTYATEDHLLSAPAAAINGTLGDAAEAVKVAEIITPVEVATALAFCTGLLHLGMGFFRLGTLSALLSEPLVNGFTTGAAVHVTVSQLKDVLGVQVPRYKGAFKIVFTVIDLFKSIPKTNIVSLVICLCIMVFMTICNEWLKPCLKKRCRLPFPGELISVIGGTLISRLLNLHGNYGVTLVGDIPKGLPMPELPRMDLVPVVAVDSIAIAIVSFSVVMSMGLTFARKHAYEVRANQELFALGMANCISSCFSCYPLACSLSRSVIQEQTGGVTQIASLVSATLIIMTLLWMGPFFSTLPRCVLAGVIIVALKPMFLQAKELKKYSKQGKLELLTWLTTFILVVLIDIDYGLLIGILISLLALYIKGLKPYCCLLGTIPEAPAVYVDLNHHRNAVEVPETKIFRYVGSLNFATNMYFRRSLYDIIGLDMKKLQRNKTAVQQNGKTIENGEVSQLNAFNFLILDFSMLGHVDVAGCKAITDIMKELKALGVRLFISSPSDRVYDTLVHSMALGEGPFETFPTLHDAVEYAKACRLA